MREVVKIRLSKPIQAHGRIVTDITLREPIGTMYMETRDFQKIVQELLPQIGDIPPSSIDQICWRDMARIGVGLLYFLEEREPKESWMHILPAPTFGTTSVESAN